MIELYKGRTLEAGMRVELYRNLHKGNFSIRDSKSKLVLAHVNNVSICDCELIVSAHGNNKVRKEQRKNVHAFVRGTFMGVLNEKDKVETVHHKVLGECDQFGNNKNVSNVTYNPYQHTSFVLEETGQSVYKVPVVHAIDNKIYGVWLK